MGNNTELFENERMRKLLFRILSEARQGMANSRTRISCQIIIDMIESEAAEYVKELIGERTSQ